MRYNYTELAAFITLTLCTTALEMSGEDVTGLWVLIVFWVLVTNWGKSK